MPLVSVIIPNYNHERFLEKRIESVLNQRFQDFEVIFMDDCSKDHSVQIFQDYIYHPKVNKVLFNDTNSGSTFLQWKKGIEAAEGEFIWIAESDDYADENFLSTLIAPLLASPQVMISYCRSVQIDEHDHTLGVLKHADVLDSQKWTQDYVETSAVEIAYYLKFRNTIPNASAVLFRKPAVLEKVLDTRMKFCGDWLFWKNLLKDPSSKIAYSSKLLNYFRTHDQTTRSSANVNPERELQRFKEYQSFLPGFFLNPFEDRFRWMMAEWIDRGMPAVFRNTRYSIVPLLHPSLVLRYYLFKLKNLFISNKTTA